MKTLLLTVLILSSLNLRAASDFPSQVEGIVTGNAILIEDGSKGKGVLVRSEQPNTREFDHLVEWGIDTFIIFKNENKSRMVSKEIASFKSHGFVLNEANTKRGKKRVYHLPISYDSAGYETSCVYTIAALKIIRDNQKDGRTTLFHCSHGQDRTGHLAGLYELLTTNHSARDIFRERMCRYGYGAGNTNKPKFVVNNIRKNLTPVFINMVALVKTGAISWKRLGYAACKIPPRTFAQLKQDSKLANDPDFTSLAQYTCGN